ncbi:MAG TPA: hypothetical protein VFV38_45825 [Ktedonobacteraceae bacterium]|nr:hypothetical protein [Ktedonobacteraceae bacterium]
MSLSEHLPAETTRGFSLLTHAELVEAFDTYVCEVGKTPRIEVRGAVDFVEPGKRPDTWRKKREVHLSDWYEVRDWKRDVPLLMIWYHLHGGIYRNASRFIDQWVRPIPLFDHQWYYLRLCPTFADFAYLQREHKAGHI